MRPLWLLGDPCEPKGRGGTPRDSSASALLFPVCGAPWFGSCCLLHHPRGLRGGGNATGWGGDLQGPPHHLRVWGSGGTHSCSHVRVPRATPSPSSPPLARVCAVPLAVVDAAWVECTLRFVLHRARRFDLGTLELVTLSLHGMSWLHDCLCSVQLCLVCTRGSVH